MRRGTRTTRANFHFDVGRLRGRNRGTLATMAADDIEQILSRAATTLKLGSIPEVPRPAGAERISEQSKNRATRIAELKQRLNR